MFQCIISICSVLQYEFTDFVLQNLCFVKWTHKKQQSNYQESNRNVLKNALKKTQKSEITVKVHQ